jgi:hypothetical protein
MLEAVQSLKELKVAKLPVELANYFGTENPEEALYDTDEILEVVSVNFLDTHLPSFARKADNDNENAIEIDVDKLPKNVKHIKVSRS